MTYDDWLEEPYQRENEEEQEERDPDEYRDPPDFMESINQYWTPETYEKD